MTTETNKPLRPPRGPSAASKQAAAYLAKHPQATANELAARFKIDAATVRRSLWWKNRNEQKEQA